MFNNCDSSLANTTIICSPLANSSWYIGNIYNITWNHNHPVYTGSEVLELQISYNTLSNATENNLVSYPNIAKNLSFYNVNITSAWGVPPPMNQDSSEIIYKIYLVPAGMKPDNTNRTLFLPVPLHVLSSNTPEVNTQTADTTPVADSNTSQSDGGSKPKWLIAIYVLVVVLVGAVFMYFISKRSTGNQNFVCIPLF